MTQDYARPLRLPAAPPHVPAGINLTKLKKSRVQLGVLRTRLKQYTNLIDTLQYIKNTSDYETTWKTLLRPYECVGFRSALEMVNESGILIHVGDDYNIVYSKEQAHEFACKRHEGIQEIINRMEQTIISFENLAKEDFGLPKDWKINEHDEVLNEEGLPFIEIYEEIVDDVPPKESTMETESSIEKPGGLKKVDLKTPLPPVTKPKEKSEFSKGFAQAIAYKPAEKYTLGAKPSETSQAPEIIVSTTIDHAKTSQPVAPSESMLSKDGSIKRKKTVKFDLPSDQPSSKSSTSLAKTIRDKIVERPMEKRETKPLNKPKEPTRNKEESSESRKFKNATNASEKQKVSNYNDDSGVLELSSGYATYSAKDLIRSTMYEYSDEEDSADEDGHFNDEENDNYAELGMDELDDIFQYRSIAMDYVRQRQSITSVPGHGPLSGEGFFSAEKNEESEFVPISDEDETSVFRRDRFKNAQMIIPTLPTATQHIMKGGGTLLDLKESYGSEKFDEDADEDEQFTAEERERIRNMLDKIAKGEISASDVDRMKAAKSSSTSELLTDSQSQSTPPKVISAVSERTLLENIVSEGIAATNPDETNNQTSTMRNKPRKVSRFKAERGT